MPFNPSLVFMAFLMRYRMQISFFLFAALLAEDVIEGVRPHAILMLSDPVGWGGAALVVIGALVRSWAAGVIHKEDRLATSGPYHFVRHPLYFGSLLMALGVCIIVADDENFLGIFALAALLYVPKIRHEEAALAKKFGMQWQAYVKRTPLFLPRLTMPAAGYVWSFAQWLHNREYNALLGSFIVLTALQFWSWS